MKKCKKKILIFFLNKFLFNFIETKIKRGGGVYNIKGLVFYVKTFEKYLYFLFFGRN